MYIQNRNRLTDIKNKLMATKGDGEGQIKGMGLTDANYCTMYKNKQQEYIVYYREF